MSVALFVHVLGTSLWIGGGVAGMVLALATREESDPVRAAAFRMLVRVHTMVIGLGALLVLGSGLLLTMKRYAGGLGDVFQEPKYWVMIVTGTVGGLLVMFVGLPTAVRTAALAVTSKDGVLPRAFHAYRRRLAWVSCIAGGLAVFALGAWYLL